jgi:hypothetical protein
MESAFAQAIDKFLCERQFIVTAFNVHEHCASFGLTFQLAQPKNQGGLSHASRSCEQQVGTIGELTLQSLEISGALKEVVVFNWGACDVSHECERSRLDAIASIYESVFIQNCILWKDA